MDDSELAAWVRLTATPGVSRAAQRRLLAAFASPQAALQAAPAALRNVVDADTAAALAEPAATFAALLDATRAWLAAGTDALPRRLVTLADAEYPALLLATADPPVLLHAAGRLSRLATPAVAIVGSRSATAQGLDHARAFGRQLSERGLAVVSGLAAGIDGAAHDGALHSAAGGTIAVVGTGLDIVYPARHRDLAARIAADGLVLSEYPLGTPPLAENFPRRNRIIAGLARGTLVVEAALNSGSLITARLALEMGREVFAIPGSVHSPQARGCHRLIQQGAKLVETVEDVVEELGWGAAVGTRAGRARSGTAAAGGAQERLFGDGGEGEGEADGEGKVPGADDDRDDAGRGEDALLAALGHDPMTLDALSARTGWTAAALGARLLDLELAGEVARLPGGLLQRRAQG